MLLTDETPTYSNMFAAVPKAVEAIQSLAVDDRLGLLWVLYKNMGSLVTPAAPGATERIRLAGTLIYEVANLPKDEQLQVMRDLVSGANTPLTRSYGCLSSNNKLAFWYQLAEWMHEGEGIAIPTDYQLSLPTQAVFNQIVTLEFNQQIAVLRLIVGKMGINPLAA